jgi:hypothetical protein
MDTSLDKQFAEVNGLKWLPWIGDKFLNLEQPRRLFVVGESHYHDNTQQSIENHASPIFTREVVEELAIDRYYYGTKIFPNFHRALFRNDIFDAAVFWNLVSFYNFIQRPMETNKGRPRYEDFYNGWKTFFGIIKLTKPETCLFIGTTAANSLADAIKDTGYSTDGVKWEDYISNAYAKTATITDKENNTIKFIFIRHTSQMFSWSKWNDYLKKVIPLQLAYFETQVESASPKL